MEQISSSTSTLFVWIAIAIGVVAMICTIIILLYKETKFCDKKIHNILTIILIGIAEGIGIAMLIIFVFAGITVLPELFNNSGCTSWDEYSAVGGYGPC